MNVTIKWLDGKQIYDIDISVVYQLGCLAVHRQYSETPDEKGQWKITHIPTGYSASGQVILKTKRVAITVCQALAKLDWSSVTPNGGTSSALFSAVRNVYFAHGLLR